jgi:hypothetical protein
MKTILDKIYEEYEALPTIQKQAEFIKRWNEQIATFNRLLWTCSNGEQYNKLNKDISRIQEELEEIVKTLSLNVK